MLSWYSTRKPFDESQLTNGRAQGPSKGPNTNEQNPEFHSIVFRSCWLWGRAGQGQRRSAWLIDIDWLIVGIDWFAAFFKASMNGQHDNSVKRRGVIVCHKRFQQPLITLSIRLDHTWRYRPAREPSTWRALFSHAQGAQPPPPPWRWSSGPELTVRGLVSSTFSD